MSATLQTGPGPLPDILRAGTAITAAPAGISNGPFVVQMLLSSQTDGALTAMRAFLEPGVVTHWHGAGGDSAFSYISVQAVKDGLAAHWFEPVALVEAFS